MSSDMKIISSLQLATLEKDTVAQDGSIIPSGTTVVLIPQTMAAAVLVGNGQTLADAWPTLSKTDHEHADYAEALAGYQANLTTLTDRLTQAEASLAQLKSLAQTEHNIAIT